MKNIFQQRAEEAMGVTENKSVLGMAEPERGFLKDYCTYATELTDAPPHYHLFVALSLVSTILTDKVYIPFGAMKIFPNLWTILLAPSSVFRKSTAINIGRRILSRVDESLLLPNEFTPEALLTGLTTKPQGIFLWSEFAGALAMFDRSYMIGMKETLTDLYDCPEVYKRKLKEAEYAIKNPCLSILAGTAIDWFLDKCKEGDIRSGFLARFLYVPAFSKTHRIGIPDRPDPAKANNLVKELRSLKDFEGEINVKYIKEKYDEWVFALEDSLSEEEEEGTLSGFWSRLGIYALKFMTIYNVAEEKSLTISDPSFFKAIELVEILRNNVRILVTENWIFGQDAKDKVKILERIQKNPGITKRTLLQNSHMLSRRFNAILDTLIEEKSVDLEEGRLYTVRHT